MSSLLIRCDATPQIGMGHIMRCISLAAELQRREIRVCFAVSSGSRLGARVADEAGFEVLEIYCPDPELPLGHIDSAQVSSAAKEMSADCVLIDHYSAKYEYFEALKLGGIRVAVIDDLGDRRLNAVDWILNQNIGFNASDYTIQKGAICLTGPRYALLRSEFQKATPLTKNKISRNVLVTLGGGDVRSETKQILESLNSIRSKLNIRVTGLTQEEANDFVSKRHGLKAMEKSDHMISHMKWADISIVAGGSTCWEMCRMGVPILVLILAKNQKTNAKALEMSGCAVNLGEILNAKKEVPLIADKIFNDLPRVQEMSRLGRILVDGKGCLRASDSILRML
jgi:UDP-2,4-diacetamido-2,4,6-trideoxy-beta-L-altropyranose hydrolase